MLTLILLVCGLAAYSSAQVQYVCNPSTACSESGFDKQDKTGCTYFCYLDSQDVAMVNSLECPDFHSAFNEWKGSETECDAECYVAAHNEIMKDTGICETEVRAAFAILSRLTPGNTETIDGNDIQQWCDDVKTYGGVPPGGRIQPFHYQIWWSVYFPQIADDSCPS